MASDSPQFLWRGFLAALLFFGLLGYGLVLMGRSDRPGVSASRWFSVPEVATGGAQPAHDPVAAEIPLAEGAGSAPKGSDSGATASENRVSQGSPAAPSGGSESAGTGQAAAESSDVLGGTAPGVAEEPVSDNSETASSTASRAATFEPATAQASAQDASSSTMPSSTAPTDSSVAARSNESSAEVSTAVPPSKPRVSGADMRPYARGCAGCHDSGQHGAPRLGDKAAWAQRLELGVEELVRRVTAPDPAHSELARSAHPSSDDVEMAIGYIFQQTFWPSAQ